MKIIKFATIGTSKITRRFLNASRECEGFELTAVYSRDRQRAEEFAAEQKASRYYNDLDEMAADAEIDAVYVASPNYMHYEHAMKMLNAGKHVICEKALASNSYEVERMFAVAADNKVILLEAARTVFDPGMEEVKKNLYKIGTIRRASLRYCQYSSRYDSFLEGQEHNIFSKECSAGALMDIGVYCVHTLLYLMGKPEEIKGYSVMLRGDIDGEGTILAKYQDKVAELEYSKITDSALPSEIQGEKGMMLFSGTINCPENVKIVYRDGKEEIIYHRAPLNDMKYEIIHFMNMINKKERADIHTERSRNAIKIMDEMRKQSGIVFPSDSKINSQVEKMKK